VSYVKTKIWDGQSLLETRDIYQRYGTAEKYIKQNTYPYGSLAGKHQPIPPSAAHGDTGPIYLVPDGNRTQSFSVAVLQDSAVIENPLVEIIMGPSGGTSVP
jgi:hypothetical protein